MAAHTRGTEFVLGENGRAARGSFLMNFETLGVFLINPVPAEVYIYMYVYIYI